MRAMRVAYGETLLELGQQNTDIIVFDADLAGSTQTALFQKKFPNRHFNMGIAESNLVLFAGGASRITGPVFASSFAMFLIGRAWEMVRNTIVHDKLNVKLVATHAGISVGEDGSSHQILEDIALVKNLPGLQIFSPADFIETKQIIRYVASIKEPVYVRLTRDVGIDVFDDTYTFIPFEPISMNQNPKSKLLVLTTGLLTGFIKQIYERLEMDHLCIDHYHIPTLKPLNINSIKEDLSKYKAIITIEEHNTIGGLGDIILSELASIHHSPIYKWGIEDRFGLSGKVQDLWEYFQLDPVSLYKRITALYQEL